MTKLAPLVATLSAVALVGCGSSSSSPGGTAPAKGGSPSASQQALNGEQTKPPQQVVADAKSALFNAPAVHVAGSVTKQGKTEKLDLQFQGEDSAGTVSVLGTPLQIVKTTGQVYINAPEQFWSKVAGSTSLAPKLANKWLKVDAGKVSGVSQFTLQGLAASLDASSKPLKPQLGSDQVGGQKAVVVSEQDGSQLFVANTGAPLPLKIVPSGGMGSLTFTDYGKRQVIKAPAGAQTPEQAAKAPTTGKA